MRRLRVDRLSRQRFAASSPSTSAPRAIRPSPLHSQITAPRFQSTAALPDTIFAGDEADLVEEEKPQPRAPRLRNLPSPPQHRALQSAKLAALRARLSLSSKIPLQTIARALVDPSADDHPRFNNANLSFVGASLLQYHTSEWLVTRYPRLPLAIMYGAMKGYAGEHTLQRIARAWGVEAAAAPGQEVDPGYLQFSREKPTVMMHRWGYERAESKELVKYKWRRGMSSRVVYDDPFGHTVTDPKPNRDEENTEDGDPNAREQIIEDAERNAHANFVRAIVGAIYLHSGSESVKTFIKSHVLSRQLDLSNMFQFKQPQRELIRLCARENFDPPAARLLSETGRMSRTPVFVVGIYSGRDMLGEAAQASLDEAKIAASINALKSWYLYSPGEVGVPSDTLAEDAKPWKPAYVDIGEIIS